MQSEIAVRAAPIGAEPGLSLVPAVPNRGTAGALRVLLLEAPPVDAVVAVRSEFPAVPESPGVLAIARSSGKQPALGVMRRPRDDIDHAVHGVGAPQGRTGSTDHFDALDVFEHHLLRVPEYTRKQGRVDGSPVNQHQQLVADRVVEAAGADSVTVGTGPRDLQIGRQAQGFRQAGDARAPNVLARDHVDRSRRVRQPLRPPGHRGHLDIGELLEGKVGKSGRLQFGRKDGGDHKGERHSGRCMGADASKNVRCARPVAEHGLTCRVRRQIPAGCFLIHQIRHDTFKNALRP